MTEGLRLEGVRITLRERELLAIDALVPPGEVFSVMGPSGAGKSTLLAFVGGFLSPPFAAEGQALLDGEDLSALPPHKRRAGLLFQDALLFPHMTVMGNLLFAIPPDVKGRGLRHAAAEAMLDQVELGGFGPRDPQTLSGGQRARVALARTLLSRPRLLLLDEPFSRLDAPLRAQMRDLVFGAAKARKLPALLVTHDEADARATGGTVLRIGA
ncbi:MAG TPA: ATP-binding cassette domain-containing protein [Mesorhizobium sp.]|jgi:putative thiamine transport system ATP-binding protein|nr:ATP-binding cassette domain-containing protein [Mesorhizobium sp.]